MDFQRCRSSLRMALTIDVMRLGLHQDLRKIRQDGAADVLRMVISLGSRHRVQRALGLRPAPG